MMPIANGFLNADQFKTEHFFDLSTTFCPSCTMFQLVEQPDPQMMFHENYAFFSSTSKKMGDHFKQMANHFMDHFIPDRDDAFVVELGSNDGIMLRHFADKKIPHLGVEPSKNVAEKAKEVGVNTISEFFGKETAKSISESYGPADIISSANVMCHIPDLNSVGEGVAHLLKDKGVFVFEDPYLLDVIQKTSYDQVYDEHVFLFSATSVKQAFARHGLDLFHVEPQKTHGGSMRYYLCQAGAHEIRTSVEDQLKKEKDVGLEDFSTYQDFAKNCEDTKKEFVSLLKKLKEQGKRVVGYAATSKSTTVLNYCDIGPDLIEYICDTTPIKQGKYSPGKHIPIKSHSFFLDDKPDYAVLFAWNHQEEVFEKEKKFKENGGKWIMFVPEVQIL